ncbi:MAG: DUF3054 domain-containing protein [Actinobacteria bacterium]|nr:DUF3054 domain-containing protein [Actinomycetota bacterium]
MRHDRPFVAADLVCVLVFAVIGRLSHDEGLSGLLATFAPFAGGMVIGHLVARWADRPRESLSGGVIVVASTVALGMMLRVMGGAGTAVAFVLVATVVLAAFMLGWRALAIGLRRRRLSSEEPAS